MKGIIVVDIPDNCYQCAVHDDEYNYCDITDRKVKDGIKPDWCPIKKVPEKKPIQTEVPFEGSSIAEAVVYVIKAVEAAQMAKGWNECIDETLKGE